MNLIQCTREQHEAFIERYKDRLIESMALICWPAIYVWYDKNAVRGSVESIVATRTFETQDAPEEFRMPEGGELNEANKP